MPIPNNGLITETNRQYYEGAQGFQVDNVAGQNSFTTTFNTDLIFGSSDNASGQYGLNNFHLYSSPDQSKRTLINSLNSSPVKFSSVICSPS